MSDFLFFPLLFFFLRLFESSNEQEYKQSNEHNDKNQQTHVKNLLSI